MTRSPARPLPEKKRRPKSKGEQGQSQKITNFFQKSQKKSRKKSGNFEEPAPSNTHSRDAISLERKNRHSDSRDPGTKEISISYLDQFMSGTLEEMETLGENPIREGKGAEEIQTQTVSEILVDKTIKKRPERNRKSSIKTGKQKGPQTEETSHKKDQENLETRPRVSKMVKKTKAESLNLEEPDCNVLVGAIARDLSLLEDPVQLFFLRSQIDRILRRVRGRERLGSSDFSGASPTKPDFEDPRGFAFG